MARFNPGVAGGTLSGYLDSNGDLQIGSGSGSPVGNVAALESLPGVADGETRYLEGYYIAGDAGGDRVFRRVATSTTTRNGGTILTSADGGRWVQEGATILARLKADWFGLKADYQRIFAPGMTSGSAVLSASGSPFTSADVGKSVVVDGAGTSGAKLVTTISSYTNANSITLAATASTTTTGGAWVEYATEASGPLQAAQTACLANKAKLIFGQALACLVTSQIDLDERCSWEGVRTERGANAVNQNGAYSALRLNWRPSDPTQYLFQEYRAPVGGNNELIYGPYEFKDFLFDFGDANGIELGRDAADLGISQTRSVVGIHFDGCAFQSAFATASTSNGTLIRSGRKALSLGHHFETVIENYSIIGADVQVYSKGGDAPTFTRGRMQGSCIPFEVYEGESGAPGTIDEVEFEIWFITPWLQGGAWMHMSNCSWEMRNTGYEGRLTLPETFAVTAGSATITASASVAQKLYKGSLLELSSGSNKDIVMVMSVSGTTVTINTDGFTFDWTAGAATGVRIHAHGPVVYGSGSLTIANSIPNSTEDTPCVVYVVGNGRVSCSNVHAVEGLSGVSNAIVIGNHHLAFPSLSTPLMTFDGCTPTVVANPANPFVRVTNQFSRNGEEYYTALRAPLAAIAEEEAVLRRRWIFTPKTTSTTVNGQNTRIMRLIAGEANTREQVSAFSVGISDFFEMYDTTLPSSAGFLRVTIRARAKTTTGTLNIVGHKTGVSSTAWGTAALTTSFKTFTYYVPIPSDWITSRSSTDNVGFYVYADQAFWFAGCVIEEVIGSIPLTATATYDPPSQATGTAWTTTITVNGAAVGMPVRASHSSITTGDWNVYGNVSAANTVTVFGRNNTGGTVDLASGTLKAVVHT